MGASPAAPAAGPPDWARPAELVGCVLYRPHLRRTLATAAVVGTVLFLINHLDAVLRGQASTSTWVATGLSYVVPFLVANTGLLVARRRAPAGASESDRRPPPTWSGRREIPGCVLHRRHLRRTAATALVVGTLYFCVNQLAAVLTGDASTSTWVAGGVTYLVPFCVANAGLLAGTYRPSSPGRAAPAGGPAA